ncbi:hypothetical protein [Amycolatopsis magusensis]
MTDERRVPAPEEQRAELKRYFASKRADPQPATDDQADDTTESTE